MRHGTLLLGGVVAMLGGCIALEEYSYDGPKGGSGGDVGSAVGASSSSSSSSSSSASSSSGALCTPIPGGNAGGAPNAFASERAEVNALGGANVHTVNAVALEREGKFFAIAGHIESPLTIQSQTITPLAYPDAFIAVSNSDGNVFKTSALDLVSGISPRAALGLAMVPGSGANGSTQVIVTGYTTVLLDPVNPMSLKNKQAFVHKVDFSGAPPPLGKWPVIVGGNGDDAAVATAVDSLGNVYVTGYVTGKGTIPACANTSALPFETAIGSTAGFVIKYDGLGACQWSKVFQIGNSASGISKPTAIAVNDDKVVVTGSFNGMVTWESGHSQTVSNPSIFVLQLDNKGAFEWDSIFQGITLIPTTQISLHTTNAIALSPTGNVYVTGGFAGTVDFGGATGAITATDNGVDAFTAAFTPDGTLQWVTPFQADAATSGNVRTGSAIAAPGSTSVYVTGTFDTIIQPTTSSSKIDSKGTNLFLAKLDVCDGHVQFFDYFGAGGLSTDMVHMSAVSNALTIAGGWSSLLNFRQESKPDGLNAVTGNRDLFFAHYNMLP